MTAHILTQQDQRPLPIEQCGCMDSPVCAKTVCAARMRSGNWIDKAVSMRPMA